MNKFIKSCGWAMHGLRTVWQEEVNFRIEIGISLAVIALGIYFKFITLEWIILIACIGAVLAAEIVNTAVEDLCNKVEPNHDPLIGKVKDMMGGFVLLVAFFAGIIGVLLFLGYF